MLLRRESPKLLAALLGHANETLVHRTYGHLILGQDQDEADRLAETLSDLHMVNQLPMADCALRS